MYVSDCFFVKNKIHETVYNIHNSIAQHESNKRKRTAEGDQTPD